MKSVILLKMRPWVFLTELPIMVLLVICCRVNDDIDGLLKLYPLIIALAALIIFLAFYFFRLVEISWEEIRDIGLFTRRDEAVITRDTALVITLPKRGKMKLILLGDRGTAAFDWMKPGEGSRELPIYRGNAYGGARAAARVLGYFGAAEGDIDAILKGGAVSFTYKYSAVSAKNSDDGREIRIDITETLSVTGVPMRRTDTEI